MKKCLSLLLVAILVLNVLPISGIAVGTPQYAVENKTVQVGDTFTVDVAIQENPGIISLRFKVVYDTEVLELQSVENKGLLNGFTTPAPTITSPYTLRWADSLATTNNTAQGTVATLTFKALQTTSSTTVTIEHGEARNATGKKVSFANNSCVVTVKEIPVDVMGVSLNKNTLSLKTGKTETLIATIAPGNATNKTVTWKSSDNTVATVDNAGKVTALKEGTATITVTTEDGSFTASCTVSVACGHTNKTETPAKSPDCVNPGNHKYYTCSACGDVFKADGVTETTVKEETISALQHDFTEKIEDAAHLVAGSGANCQQVKKYYYDCSRCNVIGTTTWNSTTRGGHQLETTWTTKDGKHYHKCSVNGCAYIADEANCSGGAATCTAKAVCGTCKKEYGSLQDHDLTHHVRNEADHSKPGNIEHWTCDDCGKYFSDASGKSEITKAQTVLNQIAHSHSTTWSKNTIKHWNECSCGDKINVYDHNYDNTCDTTCNTCDYIRTTTHTWESTLSYNATQHWTECSDCHEKKNVENHAGGEATCHEKAVCDDCQQSYGDLEDCDFTAKKAEAKYLKTAATCKDAAVYYKSCTVCGKASTESFSHGTVDSANHVGGTEICNAKNETCDVDGYTGDTYCKGCGEKTATGTVIPAGHKLDKVAANPATHDAAGNIEYYACSVCKKLFNDDRASKELIETEVVIAKGEHNYTMQHDANGHWKGCECESKIEEDKHTYGKWVTTKKPGPGVKGSKERECAVCGYKEMEEIPETTNPATGDNTQIGMLFAMLLISACGMITLFSLVPKKKGKYQR